jgi:hypothetical protein
METKTLAIVAVMIAATAAFALAPLMTSNAMARDKTTTSTECVHNGNLQTSSGECTHGKSGTTVTTTCTGHGNKIQCSTT